MPTEPPAETALPLVGDPHRTLPWHRRRVEVQDNSMRPTLHPGDRLRVDVRVYRGRSPRVGEIVVVVDPEETSRWLVKRVGAVGPGGFWRTARGLVPLVPGVPGTDIVRLSDAVERVDLVAGAVWVQGDALEVSRDSRRFGPVRSAGVVGRVYRCYAPAERRRDL